MHLSPRTRWTPLCLLVSSLAWAAPRTVTIGAGDCKNAELTTAVQVFSSAVAAQVPAEVLSSEAVLERFRPVPADTVDELDRQLQTAQTQFYSGAYDKALETLRQSVGGIDRLSPRAEPWKLLSRALMLEALVDKALNKKNEANDAQKRVLRIEPLFRLDTDYYTPATITAFDALRKEVQKAKKLKLTITSQPSGAEVFVDGALAGKTPFGSEFPPGDYRLSLANGDSLSFAREVKLARDEALQIDLAFEGSLNPQAPLCMSAAAPVTVDAALKLAALAGADNAVVLRIESRNNEPGWVTATLLEVNKGARVREGGVRFTGARRNEVLAELALFVLTGKAGASVVATLGATAPPLAPAVPPEAPKPEPVVTAVAAAPPTVDAARGMGPRLASLVLMGAGAIALGSGLVVYASGGPDRAAFGLLVDEQGRVKPQASQGEAKALQSKIDGNSTAALVLGAGGAALVAVGVAVFFLLPPDDAPQLALVPTRDGFWVGTKLSF